VQWLGAVQSQDYTGAKWAVAQRMSPTSESTLEQAFADGTLLRTHVLRPTWHFVAPADIRWMLALTAPHVHAINASYYRKNELDEAVFTRCQTLITKALEGGKQLMRSELAEVLAQNGIDTSDLRLTLIVMHAELEGLICSGAKRGKQFTYALLEERAPAAKALTRDEALAELTQRYFRSHGPATQKDYMTWSGLPAASAKTGIEMLKGLLVAEKVGKQTYWYVPTTIPAKADTTTAHLLPNFDEYIGSKTYYEAIFDERQQPWGAAEIRGFPHALVMNGYIVGLWRRVIGKNQTTVELGPTPPLTESEREALATAAQRYSAFLEMPVVIA